MTANIFRVSTLLLSIAASAFIMMSSQGIGPDFGFMFAGQDVPLRHAIILYIMTLIGVIFALIVKSNDSLEAIGWRAFWRSLLAYSTPGSIIISVVVFAYAFRSLYTQVDDWLAYFSAFQSGFFFKQTLSAVVSKMKGPRSDSDGE